MTDELCRWREHFPILERITYLNSCSQGALSDAVRAAYARYLADWDEFGSPWELWVDQEARARAAFAGLVGANPGEVAVTGSVSHAISSVASALPIEATRDTIVYTELDFPTAGQIAHAQARRGLRAVEIPASEDGSLDLDAAAELIDERTAIVLCSLVCYRNGFRLPVEELVALAHRSGALILIDAYQGIGALDVEVAGLGADLLTAGALKYLLASAGVAFLWCRSEVIEQLVPTQTGWFADEDIFAMDVHDYSPASDARRFQAGTPPVPSLYAAVAGMALVEEVGTAAIDGHVLRLAARLREETSELGGRCASPVGDSPLVSIPSSDAEALVGALADDGIVTSSRDGNLRVSLHGYNDDRDIDRLMAGLARHRHLLA